MRGLLIHHPNAVVSDTRDKPVHTWNGQDHAQYAKDDSLAIKTRAAVRDAIRCDMDKKFGKGN